jgi:Flp pilus assembly protein TadD
MVEVRPGSNRRRLRGSAGLFALVLMAGCASPDGLDFGPDRARHRELMAAQRARSGLGQEARQPTPKDKLREGDHLRLDPMDPSARERIAYIHLEDDPDRARAIFEDVLGEDPTSVNAHLGLGLAQLALGRLELARGSLETARRLNPNSPEVLSALGSVYDRMGFHEQARAELDRARALRPHDARVLNNLGIAHLLAGDEAGAEMALRESVLLDPRDKAARNNLGLVLGLREQYDDALASFREAGSEQAAQNNLGYCYFLNERYPQAITHYEKALMAEGNEDLTVLRNLANARNAESEGRVTRRHERTQGEAATEPLMLTHEDAAETTLEPETSNEASQPEQAATEPLVFTNRDVQDGTAGGEASGEASEAAPSEVAAPEAMAAPEVADETPQPATAPTADEAATPEPIVLLSEVVDATPSTPEVEPTAASEGAEPENAPAENEAAEEGEDVEETAEPAEEPLEKAVSETRPEEPTPATEPAAQAP